MKKLSFLLLTVLLTITVCNAQNPNRERIDAYRIGFFTKKMNLTSDEAEKFWPAYNDFQSQRNDLQKERINNVRDFNQNGANLSDKELTEIGDNLANSFTKESEMAQTFHSKLKEILPPDKVIRYYQAENQWKVQLLNQLQENRPAQRPNQRF